MRRYSRICCKKNRVQINSPTSLLKLSLNFSLPWPTARRFFITSQHTYTPVEIKFHKNTDPFYYPYFISNISPLFLSPLFIFNAGMSHYEPLNWVYYVSMACDSKLKHCQMTVALQYSLISAIAIPPLCSPSSRSLWLSGVFVIPHTFLEYSS